MKILAFIACLLMSLASIAQESTVNDISEGSTNKILEHYKLDYSGAPNWCVSRANVQICPTLSITFDQAVGATYTSEIGAFVFQVNSVPIQKHDCTYPNGGLNASDQGHSWKFDGLDDYLDAGDILDPAGSFSIMAIVNTNDITASHGIVSKYAGGGDRTFYLYTGTDNAIFVVCGSANCATYVSANKLSALAVGRQTILIGTFDVSTGTANLYVDALAVQTSTTPGLIPHGSTEPLRIGKMEGTTNFNGSILQIVMWDGIALTSTEGNTFRYHWLGMLSSSGNSITTASATPPAIVMAPPDSGTEPFLIDLPPNTNQVGAIVSGSGGLYSPEDIVNLPFYQSLETCAGGHPTGWTISETAGDGSAAVDCDATTYVHGIGSVKTVLTGTTSVGQVISTCLTTGVGADLYVTVWGKKTAGTSDSYLSICEYDAGDCTTFIKCTAIDGPDDWTANWVKYGGKYATDSWDAATSSYYIVYQEACDGGCTTYVDAFQVRASSVDTDAFCAVNLASAATCTDVINSIRSPISANGTMTVSGVFRLSYDPTVTQYKLWSDGVFNAANTYTGYISNNYEPGLWSSDLVGAASYAAPNVLNAAANTDYTLSWRWNGANTGFGVFWNDAWRGYTAGGGSGIRDAAQTTFSVGNDGNNNPGNFWTHDLIFYGNMK